MLFRSISTRASSSFHNLSKQARLIKLTNSWGRNRYCNRRATLPAPSLTGFQLTPFSEHTEGHLRQPNSLLYSDFLDSHIRQARVSPSPPRMAPDPIVFLLCRAASLRGGIRATIY